MENRQLKRDGGSKGKKRYAAPRLVAHGNVEKLTKANLSRTNKDGGGNSRS